MNTSKEHVNVITSVKADLEMFLLLQKTEKVKRYQIALTLFKAGFSTQQIADIMDVNVRTAHAFKLDTSKSAKEHKKLTGETKKREIKNYLKGNIETQKEFFLNCLSLVGKPSAIEKEKKKTMKILKQVCTS